MNRRLLLPLLLAGFALGLPAQLLAVGTPAETLITNTASISYDIGVTNIIQTSNTVDITVDEILNLTLSWQDAANVLVRPGDTGQMLTFLLTNTGNYNESFLLALDNGVTIGDDFDPIAPTAIYLDNDGSLDFSAGDNLYDAVTNRPDLAADGDILIFVFNAIPDVPSAPADGETAISNLTATANTGSGAPGTDFPGAGGSGSGTVAAVVGLSGGSATDDGIYQVSLLNVTIGKAATVTDPFLGSQPVPGATIQYTITVNVSGTGTATNLTVTDTIDSDVVYTAGTLELDTATLSDTPADDAGEVAGGIVTVRLGDVPAPATHIVTFDVTIP